MSEQTIILYRTAPNLERRAAQEIEASGATAILPLDESGKRARCTAPSYVGASREVRLPFARYVRRSLGRTSLAAMERLRIPRLARRADEVVPFHVGQAVRRGEVPAVVIEVRGRLVRIETTMLGKPHRQFVHYTQLRPG